MSNTQAAKTAETLDFAEDPRCDRHLKIKGEK